RRHRGVCQREREPRIRVAVHSPFELRRAAEIAGGIDPLPAGAPEHAALKEDVRAAWVVVAEEVLGEIESAADSRIRFSRIPLRPTGGLGHQDLDLEGLRRAWREGREILLRAGSRLDVAPVLDELAYLARPAARGGSRERERAQRRKGDAP